MLNAPEIIGFPQPCGERRFELIGALRRQRQAEIARLAGIAVRLAARFDAETATGFLYYETLGRPPEREDLLITAERLNRTPSMVPTIVEELMDLAHSH